MSSYFADTWKNISQGLCDSCKIVRDEETHENTTHENTMHVSKQCVGKKSYVLQKDIDNSYTISVITCYQNCNRICYESLANGRCCGCSDCVGLENFIRYNEHPHCDDFSDEDISTKRTQWDDKQRNRHPHEKPTKKYPSRRKIRHLNRTNKNPLKDRSNGKDFTV